MHDFQYIQGRLCCEQVALDTLAKRYGTPLYVYSQGTLTRHYRTLSEAMSAVDHRICFAVKSNSNQAVIRCLAREGSGFDIVSAGELQRVQAGGGDAGHCVFAGVGKSREEIEFALRQSVYALNVESEPELRRINEVAARIKIKAPVAFRVNPNVDAGTHAKITTGTYENKFGIAFESIPAVYARASRLSHIRLRGIQMHIGSQLTQVNPFFQAVKKVAPLAQTLADRYGIEFFSIGGGIGIVYDPALDSGQAKWWTTPKGRQVMTPEKYAAKLLPWLKPLKLKILLEPGRFIAGNAGVLLTRVEYVKRTGRKNFVIVDAAMNDLIRPAFYDAYHQIVPLRKKGGKTVPSDIVGPICESGDTFCKDRPMPPVKEGDVLAMMSAGAYGFVMASTYNTRPLAAEVIVHGSKSAITRPRQNIEEIWATETLPGWLTK